MKYFDAETGELLDDNTQNLSVEGRLAQRRALVEVSGRALEVVEAGIDSLGDPEPVEDTSRPEAEESPEDAQEALEAHEEAQEAAHKENLAVQGVPEDDPEPLPEDGAEGVNAEPEEKPDDARQKRRAAAKKSKSTA